MYVCVCVCVVSLGSVGSDPGGLIYFECFKTKGAAQAVFSKLNCFGY